MFCFFSSIESHYWPDAANNGIVSATERKMPSFHLTVNAAIKNSVSILSHNDCLKGQEQDSLFFYFDSQADGLNTF